MGKRIEAWAQSCGVAIKIAANIPKNNLEEDCCRQIWIFLLITLTGESAKVALFVNRKP